MCDNYENLLNTKKNDKHIFDIRYKIKKIVK